MSVNCLRFFQVNLCSVDFSSLEIEEPKPKIEEPLSKEEVQMVPAFFFLIFASNRNSIISNML